MPSYWYSVPSAECVASKFTYGVQLQFMMKFDFELTVVQFATLPFYQFATLPFY